MEKSHGTEKMQPLWKWKDETEFNWRWQSLGIRNKACKDCQHTFNKTYYEGDAKQRHLQQVKERTEAARAAGKEFVYQHLLTHPCVGPDGKGCPHHETDPQVLEFHHRDKSKKDMDITHMVSADRAINLELLTTAIFSDWKPLDIDSQAIVLNELNRIPAQNERGFATCTNQEDDGRTLATFSPILNWTRLKIRTLTRRM